MGALSLAACSGGGGGGNMPPASGNSAPVFTSASVATVDENLPGVAYHASATDTNGNPITFSISGGPDAARFSINGSSGNVAFVTAPDFEAPADADHDNIYQLTIAASDGAAQTTIAVAITVRDVVDNFVARRRAAGFAEPLFLTGAGDNSGRVFVVEKGGLIRILDPNTGAVNSTPFLDVSGSIDSSQERGLLGLAFAPNYASSGVFYVCVIGTSLNSEVRRYTVSGDPNVANASGDLILSFAQPSTSGHHKGGWIGFGNDGDLYIASGDGGGNTSTTNPAQDTSSMLGKILRIDVSGDDFPADVNRDYRIPSGNPFASGGGAPEVYAYGLRNPFRASFDLATGNLFIGDVGENTWEEVNLHPPGVGGRNYGWVRFEGTAVFNASATAPNAVTPVLQFLHGSGPSEGFSVTGGVVNRGPVEALEGDYIFGDFITGHIWSAPVESFALGSTLGAGGFAVQTTAFTPDAGAIDNISSFGTDDLGNVYIVDFDGEIFRFEEL
jgi:glucose/arabinose dehydrogenase